MLRLVAPVVAVVSVAAAGTGALFGADDEETRPLRASALPLDVSIDGKADEVAWAAAVQRWDAERAWYEGVRAAEAARIAQRRGAWEALHQCEQPDTWSASGRFGNGMAGGGGLGISNGAWNDAGGRRYAPIPGMASPDQQIAVAEVILAQHGPGAWGCALNL